MNHATFERNPFGNFFKEVMERLPRKEGWDDFYAMEDAKGIRIIQMIFESFHKSHTAIECVDEIDLVLGAQRRFPFLVTVLWEDKTYHQEQMLIPVSICGEDGSQMTEATTYAVSHYEQVYRTGKHLKVNSVILQPAPAG